jgi:AcrR family transcriptional regulator
MAAEPARRRRSPRRAQLLAAAARLFQARGYHNVSLEDIAGEVGLTGPAVYRHFSNKNDLLAQLLVEQIAAVVEVAERAADGEGTPQDRLATFLSEMAALVRDREDSLLWKQERRHLTGEQEVGFRRLARRALANTATIIGGVRPHLSNEDLEMLSWAVLSTYSLAQAYRGQPRSRIELYLRNAALAIVDTDLGPAVPGKRRVTPPPLPPGRRERILEAAIRLLDGHGYHTVSMEEIAAESDTAIATVYQSFSGKADLLHAILARGAEGQHYIMTHHLWGSHSPQEQLDQLVDDYTELAFGPHGRLLGIFEADLLYLAEDQRESLLRSQRDYVAQWAETLGEVRPELSRPEALMRARSALKLIVDLAETASVRERNGVEKRSARLVHAVLNS